jgi:hypothetical protein
MTLDAKTYSFTFKVEKSEDSSYYSTQTWNLVVLEREVDIIEEEKSLILKIDEMEVKEPLEFFISETTD